MSSNKKRKLDIPPAKRTLSAFAARQALKGNSISSRQASTTIEDKESSHTRNTYGLDENVPRLLVAPGRTVAVVEDTYEDTERNFLTKTKVLEHDKGNKLSSVESHVEHITVPVQRPSVVLSTYKPGTDNFKEFENGTISVRLAPGERLLVLGQFDLSISKGEVTLLGAVLGPSKKLHRVYAPSSHSLPVIRCSATDIDHAELSLHQCESRISKLQDLSPLFGRLWNKNSGPVSPAYAEATRNSRASSFQILFSSSVEHYGAYLQPLVFPPEWNAVLAKCSEVNRPNTQVVFICGPKSSGKSTFTKCLGNRLLSRPEHASSKKNGGKCRDIALLDLDPGQPEYSPPGHLNLVHMQQPNLGVPFSHPVPDSQNRVIRSHSLGAVSPAMDPSLYVACALDLFAHYRNLLSITPNCPLIINTPGWVLGTGLEILLELIEKLRPSEIIYMSQDGPIEVVEGLRDAAKTTPFITLPSQISEYTTRTAAHLRTMQCMSYFHLRVRSRETLSWNEQPLTMVPPWEIRYTGKCSGILGIICYGEQPPASLLAETINGTLVSIVVIDDLTAIPGWKPEYIGASEQEPSLGIDNQDDQDDQAIDGELLHPQHLLQPTIVRTPKEELPYFNPVNSICLDPSKSHSLGLALVRGIDVARRRIQILTPIDPRLIKEVNQDGKSVVLISGKLDTPAWAYTEELYQKLANEKNPTQLGSDYLLTDEEERDTIDNDESEPEDVSEQLAKVNESFQDVPWIRRLEGSRGRGVGARVWRVRRDLGKNNDGGD